VRTHLYRSIDPDESWCDVSDEDEAGLPKDRSGDAMTTRIERCDCGDCLRAAEQFGAKARLWLTYQGGKR